MRILLAAIAMLISVAAARIATAEEAALRIGVQNERLPFSYTDAEGDLQGFDVEIAWALCVRLDVRCEVLPLGFTAIIPGLQEGRIDVAVASMSITDERRQLVDFTEKYYQAANRFVAPSGSLADVSLETLAGKVIGVKRGTTHDRYLSNAHADGSLLRRYSNSDEIYVDLALGRLELTLGDAISLTESFLRTDLGAGFDFIGPALSDPKWFGYGEGIAVRKGNAELLGRLNLALRQILADGTYADIRDQYFDYDIYGDPAQAAAPSD
jgi:arginine/ornithine transport system substrate-binding protein